MGAQFNDIKLPESHMENLRIDLENGFYRVRVVQFYNYEEDCYINRDDIDFIIELEKDESIKEDLTNIPWYHIEG